MDDDNDLLDVANRLLDDDPALTRQQALRAARLRRPDLHKAFQQGADDARALKALQDLEADELRHAPEVQRFEKLCDRIQDRDRCSRFEALRRASKEMSAEDFAAYRRAMR